MQSNYKKFQELTLKFEGGYANRAPHADPGGETFAGITRKNHPNLDLWDDLDHLKKIGKTVQEINRMLPQYASFSRAFDEVYRSYWDAVNGDMLPAHLDILTADYAFQSGARQAIKDLQRVVGVNPDGIMGPATINACATSSPGAAKAYLDRRVLFMKKCKNWEENKKGWMNRIEKLKNIK